MDPFYEGPKPPRRQRRLREVPLSVRPGDTDKPSGTVSQEDITLLLDSFAFQMNRATVLIRALEEPAAKLQIPVDVNAVAVRAAVRRETGHAQGDFISFDLYKNLILKKVKDARKVTFEIATELTGNRLSDAVTIKRHMRSGGKGLSTWEEFLMNMEPFLLWMTLNQLQGTWSCVEHVECTAAKQPPGTEFGPTSYRAALAYAVMMLILGMQEDHIIFAVQQPADTIGIPPGELIENARKVLAGDRVSREMKEAIGSGDGDLITEYVDDYIQRNPVGHEEWAAYRDLIFVREHAKTTYIYSHQYSQEYTLMLDYSVTREHQTPGTSGGFLGGFIPAFGTGRQVQIVDVPPPTVAMSADHYTALSSLSMGLDHNINSIAGVLTSSFSLDLLCCFGRFLEAEDAAQLRRIRSVIQVAYNFLSNKSMAGFINFSLMDFSTHAIKQALLSFVTRYMDKVGRDIGQWVLGTADATWDDLFNCPLIYDLIQMIFDVLSEFQARILDIVNNIKIGSFDFTESISNRWQSYYDARRARAVLAIIDRVLEAIERCADYGDDEDREDPLYDPGEDPTLDQDLPRPLKLPPEVVERFFPNPNSPERDDGRPPIPAVGVPVGSTEETATVLNFREICRGTLPDDLIEAYRSQTP